MARFINIITAIILLLGAGCSEPPMQPDGMKEFSDVELALLGTWTYRSIEVAGYEFNLADIRLEPGFVKAELGGERAEITRRKVRYTTEKNYQLQWIDRGKYSLGTEGTPNWQPGYGFWHLNESEDTLLHNAGTTAETRYWFSIQNDQFIRESLRYMASTFRADGMVVWSEGDVVIFRETFIRD